MKHTTAARILVIALLFVTIKPLISVAEEQPAPAVVAKKAATSEEKEASKKISYSTDAKESDEPIELDNGKEHVNIRFAGVRNPEDVIIPIAFFLFLITLILGRKFYFNLAVISTLNTSTSF